MGIYQEDEDSATPTRTELIHLVNIWLDLEKTINEEIGANPLDLVGIHERGRGAGVSIAASDLLELLGFNFADDSHDDEAFQY
ncbi:MAG: hypothetical protein ABI947_27135 [Chloroflexota bacterium]